MNSHADKTQENKSQIIANSLPKHQGSSESTFQFVDNRPEAIVQRKLQEAINNSQQVQQLRANQEMANNSPQVKQLKAYQAMANNFTSQAAQRKENLEEETLQGKFPTIKRKENNTGLPDSLKTGIENLSDYAMDDVKVHYNSEKPAQLNAHAYAEGTNIHLASGQEKHLPHEAWHVVQQKQGRVKPSKQLKGKVLINDEQHLEKEADQMGTKAMQLRISDEQLKEQTTPKSPYSLQLVHVNSQFAIAQLTVDEELAAHNWPANPTQQFQDFAAYCEQTGWEEDDVEHLIPDVGPNEFVAIHGAIHNEALELLLSNHIPWHEIKIYATRTTGAQVNAALDVYYHGNAAHQFLGDIDHFLTTLATHAGDELTAHNPYVANDALLRLQADFPAANLVEAHGLLTINNYIVLHPRKILELQVDQLAKIVADTQVLANPAAEAPARQTAQQAMNRLEGSGSERFRFDRNAMMASDFLRPLIPAGSLAGYDALWQNSTQAEKHRAYDLYNNYHTVPQGGANMNQQSAQYAMSKNPASIPEFVNFFEFYRTHLDEELESAIQHYNVLVVEYQDPNRPDGGMTLANAQQEAAELALGGRANVPGGDNHLRRLARAETVRGMGGANLTNAQRDNVNDSYADYTHAIGDIPDSVGFQALPHGTFSPRTIGTQVRAIHAILGFTAISSAAYHTRKHSGEIPQNQVHGNTVVDKVTDYIASARNAVANGTWSYKTGQKGTESHYFVLNELRAIIVVNTDNQTAAIATYFSN